MREKRPTQASYCGHFCGRVPSAPASVCVSPMCWALSWDSIREDRAIHRAATAMGASLGCDSKNIWDPFLPLGSGDPSG